MTVLVVWALAAWPLIRYATNEIITAALVGTLLSVLYAAAGSVTLARAIGKPQTTFLKMTFGGMAVRMAVVLGALFVLITVFEMHALALTIALLVFYALFLTMEILSIQNTATMNERSEAK
jgi:hypothetical protein